MILWFETAFAVVIVPTVMLGAVPVLPSAVLAAAPLVVGVLG